MFNRYKEALSFVAWTGKCVPIWKLIQERSKEEQHPDALAVKINYQIFGSMIEDLQLAHMVLDCPALAKELFQKMMYSNPNKDEVNRNMQK